MPTFIKETKNKAVGEQLGPKNRLYVENNTRNSSCRHNGLGLNHSDLTK